MDTMHDDLLPTVNWLISLESSLSPLLPDKDEQGRRCRDGSPTASPSRTSPVSAGGVDATTQRSSIPSRDTSSGSGGGYDAIEFDPDATVVPMRSSPTMHETPQYLSNTDRPDGDGGVELDHSRPGYSFTCLIGLAVVTTPPHRLSVGQIYEYIQSNFPYFQTAKPSWRNSVRHVLSLNKFFVKQGVAVLDKGALWAVKPEMLEILLCRLEQGRGKMAEATASHIGMERLRSNADSIARHAAQYRAGSAPHELGLAADSGGSSPGCSPSPTAGRKKAGRGRGRGRGKASKPRRRASGLAISAARAASQSPMSAVSPRPASSSCIGSSFGGEQHRAQGRSSAPPATHTTPLSAGRSSAEPPRHNPPAHATCPLSQGLPELAELGSTDLLRQPRQPRQPHQPHQLHQRNSSPGPARPGPAPDQWKAEQYRWKEMMDEGWASGESMSSCGDAADQIDRGSPASQTALVEMVDANDGDIADMISGWEGSIDLIDDELILGLFDDPNFGSGQQREHGAGGGGGDGGVAGAGTPSLSMGGGPGWHCRDDQMLPSLLDPAQSGLMVHGRAYGLRYVL